MGVQPPPPGSAKLLKECSDWNAQTKSAPEAINHKRRDYFGGGGLIGGVDVLGLRMGDEPQNLFLQFLQ